MVLFLSPKKLRSSNTFLKETTDQKRELSVAVEGTMKLKESANGVFIRDDGNNGEAIVRQQPEPMEYGQREPQTTANKDGNGGNSVKNGASAGNGQLLGRSLSAPAANKYANPVSSLENGALAGNRQPLGRVTASPAANKDAKAGNSVENDGLVGTGQRQQPAADGSNNLILASTDLKLAAGSSANLTLATDLNTPLLASPIPKSPLKIGDEMKTSRQNESGSDKNTPVPSSASSNISAPSNYSSIKIAPEFTQQQIIQKNESTVAGELNTKNGTFDNGTEHSSSSANSNSEGTGDLNLDESATIISHADINASDASIRDADIQNANGTKGTNNSSSNSDGSENAEEDAEDSNFSTDGEVPAADDKEEEEAPPDYNDNEIDANGQHVSCKPPTLYRKNKTLNL
jgi:hypothetical protein